MDKLLQLREQLVAESNIRTDIRPSAEAWKLEVIIVPANRQIRFGIDKDSFDDRVWIGWFVHFPSTAGQRKRDAKVLSSR